MALAQATSVPPERVAGVLASHRRAAGLQLVDVANRAGGAFDIDDLRAIERGEGRFDEASLLHLLRAYGLDTGPILPARSELVLDLDRQTIEVNDISVEFESPVVEDVLDSYVALLRRVRRVDEHTALVLRDDDLEVLSSWLGPSADQIRVLIDDAAAPSTRAREVVRAEIVLVVVAGLALVVVAALALLRSGDGVDDAAIAPFAATAPAAQAEVLTDEPPAPILDTADEVSSIVVVPTAAPLSARAAEIEAALGWDFRTALPGWTVVYADPHPTWRGITNSVERTVTLFDRPGTSPADAAAVLAHELGHAIDLEHLTDTQRREWMTLRGIDSTWWADNGQADFAVGAGDFAEAVAAYLIDAPSRSDFGPFDDDQLTFTAAVVDALDG